MALVQAIAISLSFNLAGDLNTQLFGSMVPSFVVVLIVILTLTAGSMFTVWIGDKITELGVANGMSMLIFVGIISTAAQAFVESVAPIFRGDVDAIVIPLVFLVTLATIFAFIVFIDLGERRIPVSYAKQNRGNKLYGGQSTHIPLKVLAVGVMPIIFAFALLNFPQVIFSLFPNSKAMANYTYWIGAGGDGPGRYINAALTSLLILGFSYFYASIIFDPQEVAVNLQQNGGYILGYRPGAPTRDYLRKVYNRMTFFGAIFLAIMALIPAIIFSAALQGKGGTLTDSFSGIGMLIVVSVALEFDKQLQAAMMTRTYKGFLK
jgi:preprotein translocase subunit SecY